MKPLYLLLFIFLTSCINTTETAIVKPANESFENFNTRFHTDSLFQLSRIKFPIGGQFVDGFERHEWTIENWDLHKEPVSGKKLKGFEHTITKTDTTVVEKIWIENSGFNFERKFKIIEGQWFLTYCKDLNL